MIVVKPTSVGVSWGSTSLTDTVKSSVLAALSSVSVSVLGRLVNVGAFPELGNITQENFTSTFYSTLFYTQHFQLLMYTTFCFIIRTTLQPLLKYDYYWNNYHFINIVYHYWNTITIEINMVLRFHWNWGYWFRSARSFIYLISACRHITYNTNYLQLKKAKQRIKQYRTTHKSK